MTSTETTKISPPHLEISAGAANSKPPRHHQPSRFSFDFTANADDGGKLPFFDSRSRRRGDTWIVSLFLFIHIVIFAASMAVNDCAGKSCGDCTVKALGRFSFQPLSENPLLGPSTSTLNSMGALRHSSLTANHQTWRIFTSPWLHAGVIHLFVNLGSIGFIGIHSEEEFGPLRIGLIYILSAIFGSLIAALFVPHNPAVTSSAALFGLLGAMISSLARNWRLYTGKSAAIISISSIFIINFLLGLLPYINNFSSIGGLIAGTLLGFTVLYTPQNRKLNHYKGGLFELDSKISSVKLKQKLDKPTMRIVSLLFLVLLAAGSVALVVGGIDMNKYCSWCQYVDCVPSMRWSCRGTNPSCEAIESNEGLTLTCMSTGNYRMFPFTNISRGRMEDLCSLICS